MKNLTVSIKHSKRWERAEAVLSQRRLIFTEKAVYFQCHNAYCLEVLHQPLV